MPDYHEIKAKANIRLLFLPHATRQMSRIERMIRPEDIRTIINHGTIIEDYPEDPRGKSCLVAGIAADGRPVHVVCAPKEEYLAIITAYIPNDKQWTENYTKRIIK